MEKQIILNAIKNFKYHQIGICNVCGKMTLFVCTSLLNARNNMYCIFCGSYSRKRHIAEIMIKEVINKRFSASLCSISQIPQIKNIKIYHADINDVFYKFLSSSDNYMCSELLPNVKPDTQIAPRIFCQNLESLKFNNEMFDIVITEDVFEHVRDYEKGFREIFRVLKPGGFHIFTVPCFFDRPTIDYVNTKGDRDTYSREPEYHESRFGKIIAYRIFGIDIFETLKAIGFDTKIHFSSLADQARGIFNSHVFLSRKI